MSRVKRNEFLSMLEQELRGLPEEDIKQTLDYYSEMIDDRVEDGDDEEAVIDGLGNVSEICRKIWSEASLTKVAHARLKRSRSLKVWEIVLIVLGSPVWLPVLAAIGVVILSAYVVIWSAAIVFYAVDAALGALLPAGALSGVLYIVDGSVGAGIICLGLALFCAGACIFAFLGCNLFAKCIVILSKKIVLWIKSLIIGGRTAYENE